MWDHNERKEIQSFGSPFLFDLVWARSRVPTEARASGSPCGTTAKGRRFNYFESPFLLDIFTFASKNTDQWSVTGLSAGGQICLGLFMDPLFIDNPVYRPKNNLPLGAWATDNFLDYFDFNGGLQKLRACSDEVELTLANHVDDDVNCTGNKQYLLRSWLLNRFQSKDIRFTFLGLTDDSKACDPLAESNPVHSVKFYLRNSVSKSIKEVYCRNDSYLDQYTSVGDLLFSNRRQKAGNRNKSP